MAGEDAERHRHAYRAIALLGREGAAVGHREGEVEVVGRLDLDVGRQGDLRRGRRSGRLELGPHPEPRIERVRRRHPHCPHTDLRGHGGLGRVEARLRSERLRRARRAGDVDGERVADPGVVDPDPHPGAAALAHVELEQPARSATVAAVGLRDRRAGPERRAPHRQRHGRRERVARRDRESQRTEQREPARRHDSSGSRQTSTDTSSTGSGKRRVGLGRLHPHALGGELVQQTVRDRGAEPLERLV